MIANSYKEMLVYMLRLDDETFEKFSRSFKDFFEYSLKLSEDDAFFTVYGLFEEEFLINVLKTKPWRINTIIDTWYNSIRHVDGYISKWNKENIPTLIRFICSVISVSKTLEKHKEFSSIINYQNEKLRGHLSNLCALFGIFCLYKGWNNVAVKCKKNYKKVVDEKKVFIQIDKNLKETNDDIRNLTINHNIHFLFQEYKEDTDKSFFDKRKFVSVLKRYRKL